MNEKRIASLRAAKWYHILPIRSWMELEIHEHVGQWSNKRIWRFKGLVIKVKKPNHADGTFVIRGKVAGHTVEKIYPLSFPHFDKVLLSDKFKVRRAKLYYLRDKVWKGAKLQTLLSNDEKGVDLLELAKSEVEALQKAYEEAQKETEKEAEKEADADDKANTEEKTDETDVGADADSSEDAKADSSEDADTDTNEDTKKDTQ